MKRQLSDYVALFLIAGVVILFDQASKYLVRSNLALGEVYRPELWVSQYARIVHLHNSGAVIGIFPGQGYIILVLATLASAAIIYYYPRIPRQEQLIRLSLALLLGGAVGNIIDRLSQGYVTDFISLLNIPVLNLADLSVTAGIIMLCIGLWRRDEKQRRNPTEQADDASDEQQSGRLPAVRAPSEVTYRG